MTKKSNKELKEMWKDKQYGKLNDDERLRLMDLMQEDKDKGTLDYL